MSEKKKELISLFLIAFGILLGIWFFVPSSRGVVGGAVLGAGEFLFGFVTIFFSLLLIAVGFIILRGETLEHPLSRLAGIFIILIAICGFLDLLYGEDFVPAGRIGDLIGFALPELFGRIGAFIISSVLLLVGVVFAFEIRIKKIFSAVGSLALNVFKFFKREKKPQPIRIKLKKDEEKKIEKAEAPKPKKEKEKKAPQKKEKSEKPSQENGETATEYTLPPTSLLTKSPPSQKEEGNSDVLEKALDSFGIKAKVRDVVVGPGVIRYELEISEGQKISSIHSIASDIAMRLKAESVRILAPIPGKAAVGIEVPRAKREILHLRDLLEAQTFAECQGKLPIVMGKNVIGEEIVGDLSSMPHFLIGGSTGSGKSVFIHTIVLSLLYKFSHQYLRLLLVDPKMVELNVYNGIPHLLAPVRTDVKGTISSLRWVVWEMERRLKLFSKEGVRDISGYHEKGCELPYIVVIIDELADLMAVASKEMELFITRLSQMSRACGIHLVLATQRPSVNVITGVIKANLPARISFKVISKIDSRTILDAQGGESLLGKGDMLYLQPGASYLERIQAPFVSRREVEKVVSFIKEQGHPLEYMDFEEEVKQATLKKPEVSDELFWEAAEFLITQGKASTSLLQRRFHIGYGRAAALIDSLYEMGIVGDNMGPTKGREILIDLESLEKLKEEFNA